MSNKMMKNNEAVSPIVATLILIIVAIVASAAVMVFMNNYNAKVSNDAMNQTDIIVNSIGVTPIPTPVVLTGSLIVDGSSTLEPSARTIATMFNGAHPGVTISFGPCSGSGSGESGIVAGSIQVGMSSRSTTPTTLAPNTNIRVVKVANCGRVFIVGQGLPGTTGNVQLSKDTLIQDFGSTANGNAMDDGLADTHMVGLTATNGITASYTRATASGTADCIGDYLYNNHAYPGSPVYAAMTGKVAVADNGAIEAAIDQGTDDDARIGFIDFGYYNPAHNTQLVNIWDTTVYTTSRDNILAQINNPSGNTYPAGLVGPLYMMYNTANTVAGAFVNYAASTVADSAYTTNYVFPLDAV